MPKGKPEAQRKFHKVMSEFYQGTLRSSDGSPVKDKVKALAIAFSEARKIDPKYDMSGKKKPKTFSEAMSER